MTRAIRSFVLAAGAAALLSTQAVYAAPVNTTPAVDPLVSLSLLSTTQSRAAVCNAAAGCALPSIASATAMTSTAATSVAQQDDDDVLPPPPPPPGKTISPLIWVLGLVILAGIIVAVISGGGDGDGDLAPISPA